LIVLAPWPGAPPARALPGSQGAIITGNPAPSHEQIHSLIMRAIENQHRDDRALEEFERTEHVIARKGENAEILTDLTERVLPTGTGNIKLQMAEKGVPVSPELYRHELELAITVLDLATHPNDRYKEDLAKFERRRHDRAELVDTATNAFRATWAGRETRTDSTGAHGARTLMKFLLEPDPNYKPINRFATSFADQTHKILAMHALRCGGAGIVIDLFLDHCAVNVIGAETERDLRNLRRHHLPIGFDVGKVVEHQSADGENR